MSPRRNAGHAGAAIGQTWLITFADLIALLLAFFVMIYATQKIETGSWDALVKSLSQTLNPSRERIDHQPAAETNIRQRAQARAIDLGYLETLLAGTIAQDRALSGVVLHQLGDRLVISLPSDLLFAPGAAESLPAAGQTVAALVTVLRNVGNRIDVYGHSDPEPVSGARYASNWDLSLARARTVARLLRDAGYSRRIAAFGLADSRFAELSHVEPRERRYELARRVDIVVREARERY